MALHCNTFYLSLCLRVFLLQQFSILFNIFLISLFLRYCDLDKTDFRLL